MRQWLSSNNNTYPDHICFGEKYLTPPAMETIQRRRKDVAPTKKAKKSNLTINVEHTPNGAVILHSQTSPTSVVAPLVPVVSTTSPPFFMPPTAFQNGQTNGKAILYPYGAYPGYTPLPSPVFGTAVPPKGKGTKSVPVKPPVPINVNQPPTPTSAKATTPSGAVPTPQKFTGTSTSTSSPRMVQGSPHMVPQQFYGYYYQNMKPGVYPYMQGYPPPMPNGAFPSTTNNPPKKKTKIATQGKQPPPEVRVSPPTIPNTTNPSPTTQQPSPQFTRGPFYYPPNSKYPMPFPNGAYYSVPGTYPSGTTQPNTINNTQKYLPTYPMYPPNGRGMPIIGIPCPPPTKGKKGAPAMPGTLFKVPPSNAMPAGRGVPPIQAPQPIQKPAPKGRGRGRGAKPSVLGNRPGQQPLLVRNTMMQHVPLQQSMTPLRVMAPYGMMSPHVMPLGMPYPTPVFTNPRIPPKDVNTQDTPIIIEDKEDETMTETIEPTIEVVQDEIEKSVDVFMDALPDEEPPKQLTEKQIMKLKRILHEQQTQYPVTFHSMMFGKSDEEYYQPVVSLNSARSLPAIIYRDWETEPPKKQLLRQLMQHHYGAKYENYYQVGTIDYCHMQEWHLPQVNSLLSRAFWPCIDLRDFIKQPEHTIVVLYKRLVIGCGFITHQGYIPYLFTHPEWRRSGIAKFMLYQLIQSSMDESMQQDDFLQEMNDVTLHVSTANNAMIQLVEKFGFRQEETTPNFYAHFYDSKQSQNSYDAYYYRLKR
jgi:GNAT superfamily N-acetyltransferase